MKRNRKNTPNFIMIFLISLLVVLTVGLGSIMLWYDPTRADTAETSFAMTDNNTSDANMASVNSQEAVEVQKITDEDREKAGLYSKDDSSSDNEAQAQETESDDKTVTIVFAGDILFDSRYSVMNMISTKSGSLSSVMDAAVINELQSADIAMLNNEFPYTDRGTPTVDKKYTFHCTPSTSSFLTDMGIDIVTIANNHTYDYGETGLLDTLETLDAAGIVYAGAGKNIEEASAIRYFEKNGCKIAIIAATDIEQMDNPDTKGATNDSPGVFRAVDDSLLLQRVKEAKSAGAFTIVYMHWGSENKEELSWLQEQQSAEIADAGADLIVGAHPHLLQKIGYEGNTPVVYSLGNFLFNSRTIDTGILKAVVGQDGLEDIQFLPAVQQNCSVAFATGEDRSRILGRLSEISVDAGIDSDGHISR